MCRSGEKNAEIMRLVPGRESVGRGCQSCGGEGGERVKMEERGRIYDFSVSLRREEKKNKVLPTRLAGLKTNIGCVMRMFSGLWAVFSAPRG